MMSLTIPAKQCTSCKGIKPLFSFRTSKYGKMPWCMPCGKFNPYHGPVNEMDGRLEKPFPYTAPESKPLRKARLPKEVRLARLTEWQEIMQVEKARPCMDCGGTFPPYVYDFDHRIPAEKSFSISKGKRVGREALLAEIAKCDLVCANCHRIRTYTRH